MAAPNLEPLFAYEGQIEFAWRDILRAKELNAFIEFSDDDKETPFVDVALRNVAPSGQRRVWANTILYSTAWKGTLVSRVVTVRGKNSALQNGLLGRIRIEAQRDPYTPSVLPYHSVLLMEEHGMVRGIDEMQRLDWSELHHTIEFAIRTDAWPGTL